MHMFWRLSQYLHAHLLVAVPATVIGGVLMGSLLDVTVLRGLILPLTILIVLPIMIGLRLDTLLALNDLRVQVYTQLVNFALIPFIGFGLGRVFFADQGPLALGLLLIAVLPTSGGMTIAWTEFAQGNVRAAVKMTVIGLLLGALAAPVYIAVLIGEAIPMPLARVVQQVLSIIVVPFIVGQVIRWGLYRRYTAEVFRMAIRPRLPVLSTWGLLGLIFLAVALRADVIIAQPALILQIALPLVLFYASTYTLASVVGKRLLPRADALALVYGTALRSASLALALTMTVLGEQGGEIALLIAVAIIIQIQSAVWYTKLADTMFR
jgi:ACR3 family arsenite efflux pump ArsB